jgi:hypothetical protein
LNDLERGGVAAARRWKGRAMGMSQVVLEEKEIRALCWALHNYLPLLRYDEARVKLSRNRHEVVVQEEILSNLEARLERMLAGGSDADH